MALKAIFDTEHDIPEELREQYEEDKKLGKWVLAIEGLEAHPKVRAVATANRENATKRDELKAKVKALEERLAGYPEDFDPVEFETLKTAATEPGDRPKPDEQLTKLREQLEARHAAQLARKEADIETWKSQAETTRKRLEHRTLDVQIDAALEEAGINPKFKPAVKALLKTTNKFQVVEDGDDMAAIVETELGQVSAAEYVKTWAGGEGQMYVAPPEGAGATGNNRSRTFEKNPFAKAAWNKTEQGQIMRTDAARAERLAKSAGFASIEAASRASKALDA
jgi:hypothetical protein